MAASVYIRYLQARDVVERAAATDIGDDNSRDEGVRGAIAITSYMR